MVMHNSGHWVDCGNLAVEPDHGEWAEGSHGSDGDPQADFRRPVVELAGCASLPCKIPTSLLVGDPMVTAGLNSKCASGYQIF